MRKDQHIHTIHDLYLFMERYEEDGMCDKCKLFQEKLVGSLIDLYEEFIRENVQDVEEDKETL